MSKCIFCNSDKQDELHYGDFLHEKSKRLSVHLFCLYFSSGLAQNGNDDEGLNGFLINDITEEAKRASYLYCCYCRKKCASIGCCETKCRRTYHFTCGLKHGTEYQFIGTFRSYCNRHIRKMCSFPKPNEICYICYDPLKEPGKRSYDADFIKAPCCRNGWFHKLCLQQFARSAGYFFKCPLCNDKDIFREKIAYRGVYIPNRDAAWESEPNAFAELLERPSRCEAEFCKHLGGREAVDEQSSLLYCGTCGSVAVHQSCLPESVHSFNCAACLEVAEGNALQCDSGRESLQIVDEEEIDICNFSDDDDDIIVTPNGRKARRLQITDESSDDENERGSCKHQKTKSFNYCREESCSDEGIVVRRRIRSIIELAQNRKIIDDSDESSCSSLKPNETNQHKPYCDSDDDDPINNFSIIAKSSSALPIQSTSIGTVQHNTKNKNCAGETDERRINTTETSYCDSDDDDPINNFPTIAKSNTVLPVQFTSIGTVQHNTKNNKCAGETDERRINTTETSGSYCKLQHPVVNEEIFNAMKITCYSASKKTTFSNICQISQSQRNICREASQENALEISCIAQRTRRRSLRSSEPIDENTIQPKRTRYKWSSTSVKIDKASSPNKSGTSVSSSSYSNAQSIYTRREGSKPSSLNISCVANRTRHRKNVKKSNTFAEPNLEFIKESLEENSALSPRNSRLRTKF